VQVPGLLHESVVQLSESLHSESWLQAGTIQFSLQHIFPSGHAASWGQFAQFSPASMLPLPQVAMQSLSLTRVQPGGQ
jgi:hypothetical protein